MLVNNPYLVSSYTDGASFYRIYSDGWCEQGGQTTATESNSYTVNLLVPYASADYSVNITCLSTSNTDRGWSYAHDLATANFKTVQTAAGAKWIAFGYI